MKIKGLSHITLICENLNKILKQSLYLFIAFMLFLTPQISIAGNNINFEGIKWLEGSKNCGINHEPPIQVQPLNSDTYVLRQNPCIHPEAPFMFLLFGQSKVLLQDTGVIPLNFNDPSTFPLYDTVQNIIDEWKIRNNKRNISLIVAHSHDHSDHIGGDDQFIRKANTKLVGTSLEAVIEFFHFVDWPNQPSKLDLGNRLLEIIPIPGHQKAHIAIYDYRTGILLTGDTLYPGRLYIEDWEQYKKSIARLVEFSNKHNITAILGNHIEMTIEPYTDYRYEVTDRKFQHPLQLSLRHLIELQKALQELSVMPRKKAYAEFIVEPL